ncbi:imidazolonepropionase-like domain-containing protein [Brevibacillus fluminis]|uniref:imidazolonepropionase-like domain-containing protein n=1 Tax=Brevibacillus fluminis TaxID=511487 RepID=UPI003F89A533
MTKQAFLFHGGSILTMTAAEAAEAIAVRGDRIVGVGSLADCRQALAGTMPPKSI